MINFDAGELYCLLLACDSFCEEYSPVTHGESTHLEKTIKVRDRLRRWHNEERIKLGYSPCYPEVAA